MSTDFRILPLDREAFEPMLNDPSSGTGLKNARWLRADASPGFPCRVSLQDAGTGEAVLAVNYLHHDVASPYRASGPIFVRANAVTRRPAVNEIPVMLRHRQLSLRAYDADAMMIAATVTPGEDLERGIRELFDDEAVEYLHIHNAGPGCYNCSVVRAG